MIIVNKSNIHMLNENIEVGLQPNIFKCNKLSFTSNDNGNKHLYKKVNIAYQLIDGHIYLKLLPSDTVINIKTESSEKELDISIPNSIVPDFIKNRNYKFNDSDNNDDDKTISDKLFVYLRDSLSKNLVRENILTSHNYYCIDFLPNTLINEILDSFSRQKEKIFNQVSVDFPRMKINYNSIHYQNINNFCASISKYNFYKHDLMDSIYQLILLLCTQASFFYPFSIIHNLYNLPDTNIFIVSGEDHPYINITDNSDNEKTVIVTLKKTFKYMDTNTRNVILNFHTFMVVTIRLNETFHELIYSNTKSGVCSSAKIYWYKDRNIAII